MKVIQATQEKRERDLKRKRLILCVGEKYMFHMPQEEARQLAIDINKLLVNKEKTSKKR
jgi:hypothetical protein